MSLPFRSLQSISYTVALAAVIVSTKAQADIITLNVNSAQSSLSLAGNAFGLDYAQQNAGSLVTSLSGTMTANLTAGVLTFTGGSAISANLNPTGPYTSAPNPIGVEAGNFGVTANGVVAGFGTVTINGVYKNLVIDITSGTAQNGVALTGATMNFSAGALDFGIANPAPLSVGTSNLQNVSGPNTSNSLVTFNGTTLTIPVAFRTTGSNRFEDWSGTIVATIVAVPEPSSILLTFVGLGGITLACILRRKFHVNGGMAV
ncbi:MAG: PEP-CTERM sorting domain-containing protein [Pirellula sp.]